MRARVCVRVLGVFPRELFACSQKHCSVALFCSALPGLGFLLRALLCHLSTGRKIAPHGFLMGLLMSTSSLEVSPLSRSLRVSCCLQQASKREVELHCRVSFEKAERRIWKWGWGARAKRYGIKPAGPRVGSRMLVGGQVWKTQLFSLSWEAARR